MTAKTDAAKGDTELKNVPAVKPAETPKIDPKKQESEIKALLNPTPEQRIKNLRNFQLITERYGELKEKEDELNAFMVSSDGTQERFKLSNSMGYSFEFTNTQVIEDVITVVGNHLKARIEKTEREILEFTI